jgi:nucleotide-binding universal stress UspA family protein
MGNIDIKRILVPHDFSETAFNATECAATMAELYEANLYILHVSETSMYKFVKVNNESGEKTKVLLQDYIWKKLKEAAEKITEKYKVNVITLIGEGRPHKVIAENVNQNKIDVIVMGTHGASGAQELIMGSNAQKVVSMSVCPVITIQTKAKNFQFKKIVMPVVTNSRSELKLAYVKDLALKYNSKVEIVGINEPRKSSVNNDLDSYIDAAHDELETAGVHSGKEIIEGKNTAEETLKYAQKAEADLIVIVSNYESGMTGGFLGSHPKQIVNHSPIPVFNIPQSLPHNIVVKKRRAGFFDITDTKLN